MSVLLITYDVTGDDPSLERFLTVVSGYKHIRLSEGSYVIETDEKTRTVFEKILPCLKANVHLLIVTLVKPFAGPAPGPVRAWLTKHLPEA